MAEPARRSSLLDDPSSEEDDRPSLDPLAIERAYRRERARRRARIQRRTAARHSGVRFWVALLVLSFVAVFILLMAWREIQTLFGV
ncbi:MAG TPA: hypothetical protein VHC45_06890 [Gaiellaceae bacterium]|nr:hypothetical protein [Gaiellaceae bacterium]